MIRTYTYKIYKNNKLERKFYRWLGTCRYVYNVAKEAKEIAFKNGVSVSRYDLQKQLTELKKEPELAFVKDVNAQVLQDALKRLDLAYKKFYKDVKSGERLRKQTQYLAHCKSFNLQVNWSKFKSICLPNWANRRKWNSFTFPQFVKRTEKGFLLPKFGEVKVHNNRKIEGQIKSATLVRKADGIFIHVVMEVPDTININENQVGIDMGVKYFLTTSDNVHIENPRHLNKPLAKLRIENRSLARKRKGSKRREKQVTKLQRTYLKVSRVRRDFLHKQSSLIANNYGFVAVENLNIKGMVRNSKLSRHISDVSWGTFFELLRYKTNVTKVNPAYTSQKCSKCGEIHAESRMTQSHFECVVCGYTENADINAAKNIMGRAFPDSRKRESEDCALAVESPRF